MHRFDEAIDALLDAQENGTQEMIAAAEAELDEAYNALVGFNRLFGG